MTYVGLRAKIDLDECRKWVKDNLMCDVSDGSFIAVRYASEIGVDDPISYDPKVGGVLDPDFLEFVDGLLDDLIDGEIWTLSNMVDDESHIEIWRAMIVSEDWLASPKDPSALGICWAWDEQFAITHNGYVAEEGQVEIRLRAKAHVDDVDWTASVALCAADEYYTGTENEIRMREGRPVTLISIERKDDQGIFVDIAEVAELTFSP